MQVLLFPSSDMAIRFLVERDSIIRHGKRNRLRHRGSEMLSGQNRIIVDDSASCSEIFGEWMRSPGRVFARSLSAPGKHKRVYED